MEPARVDRLLRALFPPPSSDRSAPPSVFAILDGARDERIYRAVYDSHLGYECLFAGTISYELALAAPYLVELRRDATFTRWLVEEGWGQSFGVLAWAHADLETMRRHCRRILQVKDEAGRRLFFRFYDPRVLRTYLPTCNVAELREVLGPATRMIAEGAAGEVVAYELGGRPLRVTEQALD
jgi:hypothetical protein